MHEVRPSSDVKCFCHVELNCTKARLQHGRNTTLIQTSCQSHTKFKIYWNHACVLLVSPWPHKVAILKEIHGIKFRNFFWHSRRIPAVTESCSTTELDKLVWTGPKIFAVPDFKTSQQSAPHIKLEMPRQSQQGSAQRVRVANNFDTSVSHGTQRFPKYFYNYNRRNMQLYNFYSFSLDASNLNAFQTFWPRLCILQLVDVP